MKYSVERSRFTKAARNAIDIVCVLGFLVFSFITFVLFYIYRSLVTCYVSVFKLDFGKVLSGTSAILEEDYWIGAPKYGIVSILKIEHKLCIDLVRETFINNVLTNSKYPELKQYQYDFMGYRFWRNDKSFNVENHVYQRYPTEFPNLSVETIHEEFINKPFDRLKSPWELVLINLPSENADTGATQSLLVYRNHHSMADGKSILKLLFESFGQQKLVTALARYEKRSVLQQLCFYLRSPIQLVNLGLLWKQAYLNSMGHLFKFNSSPQKENQTRLIVGLSPVIPLDQLKSIAKKKNVRVSAVILSIMAGAMRKLNRLNRDKNVSVLCVIPKEGHPDALTNYMYMGSIDLPVSESSDLKRLNLCNKIYNSVSSSDLLCLTNFYGYQIGVFVGQLRKTLRTVRAWIVGISNLAGDEQGVKICSYPCSDFVMSVGPCRGTMGIQLLSSSYRGKLQIAITAKEGILDRGEVERLAFLMGKEVQNMVAK
ncbi:O-acyltransferase WSD1 [Orchesella cincta]|uniref:O-acyltransferase WSD1 n=1 Tax=Orchesella cincta TaxID=48709 RepID=A0A1D2MJI2_ORCCI|nr:O-acyltransferase WSD1 [Orchesella cincta]